MNIFYPAHKMILKSFIKAKVDFMIVGGYAVIFHGYNRVTSDMDIWLRPDNENRDTLIKALTELRFDETGIATIASWDFTKPIVFHTGKVPDRTDFLTHLVGIKYLEAKAMAITSVIDNLSIQFIHINTLIQNKSSTGRLKDKADVEYLERILELRNKKS